MSTGPLGWRAGNLSLPERWGPARSIVDPHEHPPLALHRRPVLVPVGVLAGDAPVVVDEELHRLGEDMTSAGPSTWAQAPKNASVNTQSETCGSRPEVAGLHRGLAGADHDPAGLVDGRGDRATAAAARRAALVASTAWWLARMQLAGLVERPSAHRGEEAAEARRALEDGADRAGVAPLDDALRVERGTPSGAAPTTGAVSPYSAMTCWSTSASSANLKPSCSAHVGVAVDVLG